MTVYCASGKFYEKRDFPLFLLQLSPVFILVRVKSDFTIEGGYRESMLMQSRYYAFRGIVKSRVFKVFLFVFSVE